MHLIYLRLFLLIVIITSFSQHCPCVYFTLEQSGSALEQSGSTLEQSGSTLEQSGSTLEQSGSTLYQNHLYVLDNC